MNLSLVLTVDGDPKEVVTWFVQHFGAEAVGPAGADSEESDEWTDELADRFVRHVSDRARDLLYALAGAGPRGLDSYDLGLHHGMGDEDIEDAVASISELATRLNISEKGIGGVLSSIGTATKTGFPNPMRWDPNLEAYVMERSVANTIGSALNRLDPKQFISREKEA